jgi:hypothetical protein
MAVFPRWADYNARLSSVFQESRPVAEVAILGRTADLWSRTGLERDPFHLEPGYLHRLWEPLSQLGLGSNYLHEAVIQEAKTDGGSLRKGENQLTVRYTTTLWNAMDRKEPQPSGLLGPVTLR